MNVLISAISPSMAAAWVECDRWIREQLEQLWSSDLEASDLALNLWGEAGVAAKVGDWGSVSIALSTAAIIEPDVYTRAFQLFAWSCASQLGATGEAANGPSPLVTDGHRSQIVVPTPQPITPGRWASAHGQATVTGSGALRIEIPRDLGRNYTVTLPLDFARCGRG